MVKKDDATMSRTENAIEVDAIAVTASRGMI
jgi:hypothetical protein